MKVCMEDGSHETNRYAEDSRKGEFKGTKSQKGKEGGRGGEWEQQQEEEMKSGEEATVESSFRRGRRHQSLHHPPIEESVTDGEPKYPLGRNGRHEQWQS